MENIISRIYELLKETNNLIEFEEQIKLLMYNTFADLVGEVFNQLNKVIKEQKQPENWKVERNDQKGIQFVFWDVQFQRKLMIIDKGNLRYHLYDWICVR